jgi:hypothetical protein
VRKPGKKKNETVRQKRREEQVREGNKERLTTRQRHRRADSVTDRERKVRTEKQFVSTISSITE